MEKRFMDAWSKYYARFKLWLFASKEVCGTDEAALACIELIEKSCREGYDYVAERYGLNREQQLKHYDYTLD